MTERTFEDESSQRDKKVANLTAGKKSNEWQKSFPYNKFYF